MISVGDKVLYVPDQVHSSDLIPNKGYAFHVEGETVQGKKLEKESDVFRERKLGNLKSMIFTKPKFFWNAEVIAETEKEGTYRLLIVHPNGYQKMEYDVPFDATKTKLHSFHLED